jgi:hypothetical protein
VTEKASTSSASNPNLPAPLQNDLVKKLVWSGVLATVGAIAAIASRKVAEQIWIRLFNESPPID